MKGARGWLLGVAVGSGVTTVSIAPARDEVPGMLFQGGTVVPPPVVEIDPALPIGHRAVWEKRPTYVRAEQAPSGKGKLSRSTGAAPSAAVDAHQRSLVAAASKPDSGDAVTSGASESPLRTCDPAFPVCVHGAVESDRGRALRLLREAYRVWNYVLAMPAPLGDGTLGGGPELDVYLAPSSDASLRVASDPPLLRSDRTSSWCEVGVSTFTERRAAQCVAEASAAGVDAAESPAVRRGWASYQLDAAYPPDSEVFEAFAAAQLEPSAPLLARHSSASSEAAKSFWAYLDDTHGVDGRGKLPLALLQLSRVEEAGVSPHPEWRNSPDVLDVLRHAYGNDASRIARFWSNWAVSRAFLGSRAAGNRPHDFRSLGDAARVAFDWTIDYSSLPRHLAGPAPVHPLGTAYVWVELDSVPLNAVLALRVEWEAPTPFAWAVVSVDAQGREVNRWQLPYLENATSAETTLVQFQEAEGLIVVGINLGQIDVSHPVDPDQQPWEPHAYSIYLTELAP